MWLEDEDVHQLEELDVEVVPLDESDEEGEQDEQQEKPEEAEECLPVLGERLALLSVD